MRFDPAHWHISLLALPLAAACTAPIPIDDDGADAGSDTGESGFVDPETGSADTSDSADTETGTETDTDEPGCELDSDCWYPLVCVNGACEYPPEPPPPPPPECETDADCPEGVCASGHECYAVPNIGACAEPPIPKPLPIPAPLEGVLVLSATVADFDGDGTDEIVIGHTGVDGPEVRAIVDGMTVDTPVDWDEAELGPMAALDSNGDGALDLLWGRAHMVGDGAGGFGLPAAAGNEFLPAEQHAIDVDGDGHDELVRRDWASGLLVFANDAGVLSEEIIGYEDSFSYAVGDFDGDGDDDLAHSSVEISKYDGGDAFWPSTSLDEVPGAGHRLVSGHLELAERHDLVSVSRRLGEQTLIFAWRQAVMDVGLIPGRYYHSVLGDFDGDGTDELITIGSEDKNLAWVDIPESLADGCHAKLGITADTPRLWAADIDGDQRDELILLVDQGLLLYDLL